MRPLAAPPPVPAGVTGLVALFEYGGREREVILGLKHTRGVGSVPHLADALADAVRLMDWEPAPAAVTWVPTTRGRRRARGYDQSHLLAKAVARRLSIPCRRLLLREGRAQEGLDAAARRIGPRLAARRRIGIPVLVVDDVVTTGASLSAAAAALRSVGAPEVFAAVLSFTPAPSDRRSSRA